MNDFAKLETVDTRQAWAHEALDFTPWLSENLDRIQEYAKQLEEKPRVPMTDSDKYFFGTGRDGDYTDVAQQPELIDWLSGMVVVYERVLTEVLNGRN